VQNDKNHFPFDVCVGNEGFVCQKSDFRGQKNDFRGQKSDFHGQKTDFRGQKTDFRGSKSRLLWVEKDKKTKKGCPFFENKHHLSIERERERERKKKFVLLNC